MGDDMVDQLWPLLAPGCSEDSEAGRAHAIVAEPLTAECTDYLSRPKVVLVVGVDAEYVYMMVVASRPGMLEFYVPILPSFAHEMQPDPVSPIPSNGFLSPAYLHFTHIIRGRPVILENGQRHQARASGPKGAHVQQLGDNTSPLAISLSAKDMTYLRQCHRNF